MDGTKRTIIIILSCLVVLAAAAALLKAASERDLSFSNPVISAEGRLLAYLCYKESDSGDGANSVQLRAADFEKHEKKEFFTLALKPKEDMIIDSVSSDEIKYSVANYDAGTFEHFSFSIPKGSSEFVKKTKGEETEDRIIPCPSNPKMKIAIRYVAEASSSILFISESGAEIKIKDVPAYDGYLYAPEWAGENIVFQGHIKTANVFSNRIWFYQTGTGVLSEIEKDCSCYIVSPCGKYIVLLMPSSVNGKNIWEMEIKRLSDMDKTESVDTICYDKEVFLYEWSPSSSGFMLQSGNSLCYYDIASMKSRTLMEAEKDGWWGYPLSMYYACFSPDGKKAAVLAYREIQGGYSENMLLIDVSTAAKKKIYSGSLPEFGKKQPFRPEFYRHVVWNPLNGMIIFESKDDKDPDQKRIVVVSSDGLKKKIISSSLF